MSSSALNGLPPGRARWSSATNRSSASSAAPESIACSASRTPSSKLGDAVRRRTARRRRSARPASAAGRPRRRAPRARSRRSRSGVPPATSLVARRARARRRSGETVCAVTPSGVTSSSARLAGDADLVHAVLARDDRARAGSRARTSAPAISPGRRGRRRRSAGASAPAGLVSGPRKLKIVRTPSALRTGTTCRVAWWCAGANMKPKPTSSMQRATACGVEVDAGAERLEQVGRARQAGRRAVAVLGDAAARAGGDERGGGRDVEGRRAAAGAGRVEQVVAGRPHRQRQLAHRAREARSARRPSRPSCAARSGRRRSAPRRRRRP